MEYLDPGDTVLWKDELLAGRVDPAVAAAVGDRLGTVHASTAARPELAATFAYRENFVALRMDPYLRRLVPRHPELGNAIERLVATILGHERALVHGDVSPKNILVGPTGPCFVDAETAVWGDPAFDLAFCLNHLLLKTQVPGLPVDLLLASLDALVTAYAARVRWEPAADVLGRVAALLPALLLARVDGKSPVEYFDDAQRAWVRVFALPRIVAPPADITDLVYAWRTEMT